MERMVMMRYTAEELRGFAARIMEKAGLSPAARDIFSDSLSRRTCGESPPTA